MKMRSFSLPTAATAVVASAVMVVLSAMALGTAAAAIVEHTFVVSQMNMRHRCNDTLVTVVNGQFPGPAIEVNEGDSVVVHVVNKSPHNITIHWHGVKQRLNCWADGVPVVTQCPILPNQNFTYRFKVDGQEGTLWWHAHVTCLRATVHGALIIRPRHGASSYPFPKPHKEIPIIIGEWWQIDPDRLDRHLKAGNLRDNATAAAMNGKLGDLYNCSGVKEEGYVLDVEPGKTYLLRVINAALYNEYYLKIAGHKFTVVAVDANYVNPYTTDIVVVAPGETVDVLVVADAPPGRYYFTALGDQAPEPERQIPKFVTRGVVRYITSHNSSGDGGTAPPPCSSRGAAAAAGEAVVGEAEALPCLDAPPVAPDMPDQHDIMLSYYFHGNLTSLNHTRRTPVPAGPADESMFITLGDGSVCRDGGVSCKRSGDLESIIVATMNNVSFELPAVTRPLLESHYYHTGDMEELFQELPGRPPARFNYTDVSFTAWGPAEAPLEPTVKRSVARRFRHGSVVDIVFQSTAVMQSDSNPMHLHGHDMFVLAQGLGNYDAARDVAKYNLVDPPVRNSVLVPNLGWAAIRFVADNPGIWYMHCHYEFHLAMGMATVFIVEDGPTASTSLPPPPSEGLACNNNHGHDHHLLPKELYLKPTETEVERVKEV